MQNNLFEYIKENSELERVLQKLEDMNFKDFAEEMDYINFKMPERDRDILFGKEGVRSKRPPKQCYDL